jgi:hypothetical protein
LLFQLLDCKKRAMILSFCQADNPNVKFLNPYPNQFKRYTVDLNIEMYRSFEVTNDELQCDNVIEGTTVFIVRFEYHNLFHTSTDWFAVVPLPLCFPRASLTCDVVLQV